MWSTLRRRFGGGERERSTVALLEGTSSLVRGSSNLEVSVEFSKALSEVRSSNPEKSSSISRSSIRKSSFIESENLLSRQLLALWALWLRALSSQGSLESFEMRAEAEELVEESIVIRLMMFPLGDWRRKIMRNHVADEATNNVL